MASKSKSKSSAAATLTAPKGSVHNVVEFSDDSQTDVFDLVASYNPKKDGTWQEFIKSDRVREALGRKLLINETGLSVPLDGKVADAAAALSGVVTVWGGISQNWEATSAYGNQHYTAQGPMHFNGVDRLSTDALMLNAAMFIEVIAQRAGLKALSPDDPNFAQAQAALSALRQFAQNRPGEIKDAKKAQMYAAVGKGDEAEVVSKADTAAA